jgi:hypothetical protein
MNIFFIIQLKIILNRKIFYIVIFMINYNNFKYYIISDKL